MAYVSGNLRAVLRLEGLGILLLSLMAFHKFSPDWAMFAWLFWIPDLALLGYLVNARTGAVAYNITHSTIGAASLMGIGLVGEINLALSVSFVWFAHIGFDRALGYGLKYSRGFRETHLGKIGRSTDTA
ncbi:DUF4260 domain-containing protein [Vibrio mangrovi]|uniref:DUF4260 domain-containing protein n=1 Tax=Vibrio mangrovi TaxID=474394 RepID=A0A1Y6IWX5_9VIBR|nr:DUF4260 domain-containing protein [Vibrio mangrovi]MDW6001435.1 DUF4260 domain-containing protein [Vibrio mangrovi]SMS00543.1 hypothetical protein VIM7927_01809 [Vibrio mangrovi]